MGSDEPCRHGLRLIMPCAFKSDFRGETSETDPLFLFFISRSFPCNKEDQGRSGPGRDKSNAAATAII
jgi:hypothetical protein